jgi:hypothetical protein
MADVPDISEHVAAFQAALEANPVPAPKFTAPGIVERIYASLAAGNFRCTAAAEAGVSEDSVDGWVKRGEGDVAAEPYATFARSVRTLRANVENARRERVEKAAALDWRAAAWLLEKHNRAKYGESRHVELTGKHGAPLTVSLDRLLEATAVGDENEHAGALDGTALPSEKSEG